MKDDEIGSLLAGEEWMRTFDAVVDPIFIIDTHDTIIRANEALLVLLNVKEEDVVGKKCYEIMHGMTKPWPNCPLEKTKSDKKSHTQEVDDPHIGIPLLVTTSPIFDDNNELIVKTVDLKKEIENITTALNLADKYKAQNR